MHYCRPCGCKGVRTCLVCEREFNLKPISTSDTNKVYYYCYVCQKAWTNSHPHVEKECPDHDGESIYVPGIFVLPNFITEKEREEIVNGMNRETWDPSQSGRRKQNYGPKCNFKKKKIQIGQFNGFPRYSEVIHNKLRTLPMLNDFCVIEQCSLEYDPDRGASIDPHIDDCWIWGERILTVNVTGDTFLSMVRYKGPMTKYNLDEVRSYPRVLDESGNRVDPCDSQVFKFVDESEYLSDVTVKIFMPEKSLIVLYGSARYEWEHFVLRSDITHLRVCLAFREFTPPYLPGGEKEGIGSSILDMSKNFW